MQNNHLSVSEDEISYVAHHVLSTAENSFVMNVTGFCRFCQICSKEIEISDFKSHFSSCSPLICQKIIELAPIYFGTFSQIKKSDIMRIKNQSQKFSMLRISDILKRLKIYERRNRFNVNTNLWWENPYTYTKDSLLKNCKKELSSELEMNKKISKNFMDKNDTMKMKKKNDSLNRYMQNVSYLNNIFKMDYETEKMENFKKKNKKENIDLIDELKGINDRLDDIMGEKVLEIHDCIKF